MKISVLDRDAIGKDIDISGFEKFGNVTVHDRTVAADAVKNIGDADIAVTNKVRLSAEILAAAPNLKFIAEAATGVDNIDTAFCLVTRHRRGERSRLFDFFRGAGNGLPLPA